MSKDVSPEELTSYLRWINQRVTKLERFPVGPLGPNTEARAVVAVADLSAVAPDAPVGAPFLNLATMTVWTVTGYGTQVDSGLDLAAWLAANP